MKCREPILTIFVPTVTGREACFRRLRVELEAQVTRAGAFSDVEIVTEKDDGALTIGDKRNLMLARARGAYVVSIDDDDEIHPDYVTLVLRALKENPGVDCLGLKGEMVFENGVRQSFVYSSKYREYWTRAGVITRPPHHLNPIRRSIALEFPFEPVRAHEDADVAMRMARAGVLKREVMIEDVLYIYHTRRDLRWHRLLERTEIVRHPLMIKTVNLVRLRRAMRTWLGALTAPEIGSLR